jgi:hypothetical protein
MLVEIISPPCSGTSRALPSFKFNSILVEMVEVWEIFFFVIMDILIQEKEGPEGSERKNFKRGLDTSKRLVQQDLTLPVDSFTSPTVHITIVML